MFLFLLIMSLYIHAFVKDARSLSCHLILYSNIEIHCLPMFNSDRLIQLKNHISKVFDEKLLDFYLIDKHLLHTF